MVERLVQGNVMRSEKLPSSEPPQPQTRNELQAWVRDRLRSSRVPEQIRFVETLPYNELGKLLRRRVRTDVFGK